jgi:hypothetical protein
VIAADRSARRTETRSLDDDDAVVQPLADIATIATLQNRVAVEQRDINTQHSGRADDRPIDDFDQA